MTIYKNSRKLSKRKINLLLKNKGSPVRMVGRYLNSTTATQFRSLSCNHSWITNPANVIYANAGCPICARKNLTKESINTELVQKKRTERLLGEYTNSQVKSLFNSITCSHVWYATPASVLYGSGCPYCNNVLPLTIDLINQRLREQNRNIVMTGQYTNNNTKTTFKSLDCNHEWLAIPRNVINKGSGCPSCNKTGFSISKPAWKYVLSGLTEDGLAFIKYGITNNLDTRLAKHLHTNLSYKLVFSEYNQDGKTILDWENGIKRLFGGKYLDKKRCPDGWTETLPIDRLASVIHFTAH